MFMSPNLTPDPKDMVFCLLEDSLDCFIASWIIRKRAMSDNIPVEFSKAVTETDDLSGRNLLLFSGFSEAPRGKSAILVSRASTGLPPPLPFAKWERTRPFGIKTMALPGDSSVAAIHGPSLCRAVWDFLYPDITRAPRLVNYVTDVLSGEFKLNDSRAVVECIDSYEPSFSVMDRLEEALSDPARRELAIAGGESILRHKAKARSGA